MLEVILPKLGGAATLFGAGTVVIAQAVFDNFAEPLERVIGGSVLFAAAVLIVRWTFRLLNEARESAAADRKAYLEREARLTDQLAELNAQLLQERQLRMSLEAMGYENRRRNGYDEPPP